MKPVNNKLKAVNVFVVIYFVLMQLYWVAMIGRAIYQHNSGMLPTIAMGGFMFIFNIFFLISTYQKGD